MVFHVRIRELCFRNTFVAKCLHCVGHYVSDFVRLKKVFKLLFYCLFPLFSLFLLFEFHHNTKRLFCTVQMYLILCIFNDAKISNFSWKKKKKRFYLLLFAFSLFCGIVCFWEFFFSLFNDEFSGYCLKTMIQYDRQFMWETIWDTPFQKIIFYVAVRSSIFV